MTGPVSTVSAPPSLIESPFYCEAHVLGSVCKSNSLTQKNTLSYSREPGVFVASSSYQNGAPVPMDRRFYCSGPKVVLPFELYC